MKIQIEQMRGVEAGAVSLDPYEQRVDGSAVCWSGLEDRTDLGK